MFADIEQLLYMQGLSKLSKNFIFFICVKIKATKMVQLEQSKAIFLINHTGKDVLSCMTAAERLVVKIKKNKRKILFKEICFYCPKYVPLY